MEQFLNKHLISFSIGWRKLVLALIVFCFFSAKELRILKSFDVGVADFILISISNQYYLLFFGLPLYLYFLFSTLSNKSTMVMNRYRFFYRYFLGDMIPIILFAFVYSVLPALCAWLIGQAAGLSMNFQQTIEIMQPQSYGNFFELIQKTFNSSIIAIIFTVLYTFIGLTFFSLIIKFSLYFLKKKTVLFFIILLYILAIFAVQKEIDLIFPYMFINNYFILWYALGKNCLWIISFVMIVISAIIVFLSKKRWGCRDLC